MLLIHPFTHTRSDWLPCRAPISSSGGLASYSGRDRTLSPPTARWKVNVINITDYCPEPENNIIKQICKDFHLPAINGIMGDRPRYERPCRRRPGWFFCVHAPPILPVSDFIPGTVSSPDCLLNQGKSSLILQIWPASICATAADSSGREAERMWESERRRERVCVREWVRENMWECERVRESVWEWVW